MTETGEKYLCIDVTGLGDMPLGKQELFCGVAKLLYLKMYRDHQEVGLEVLRKELLQRLKACGDNMDTVAMGDFISSI